MIDWYFVAAALAVVALLGIGAWAIYWTGREDGYADRQRELVAAAAWRRAAGDRAELELRGDR